MTRPNGPPSRSETLAKVAAFLLILLPGLGQHFAPTAEASWTAWALLGVTAVGMILALLLP
jgi:hypothetical protein